LCDIGGGIEIVHSIAWYVDRHANAAESLANALDSGQKWRQAKLESSIMAVSPFDDSAARVARDKLKLSITNNKKTDDAKKVGYGIGQAIIDAQQRAAAIEQAAKVIDVMPEPVRLVSSSDR
jgi:hypothetical protein